MKRYGILMMTLLFWGLTMGMGRAAESPKLHAAGRAKNGVNWLRWAPETPEQWERLLAQGVVVERYAYMGDTVLAAEWRRPPLSTADSLAFAACAEAAGDGYTVAMGDLLFADSLEIGPGGNRFSRLSQERDQRQMRFAMALLIGDRSYAAACAGLLGWRDSLDGVEGASAYLYRVYVPNTAMDTATVQLRPEAGLLLPPQTLLTADFRDETVTLRWDCKLWSGLCVGYYVERAVGGGGFTVCNAHPIDVLQRDRAGAEELRYVDSLPGRRRVRYRVVGVDMFGDRFPVTGEVVGEAEATGLSAPQIMQAAADAKGGVTVSWRYPDGQEKALARFEVFVKDSMYGAYRSLGTVSPKTRRLAVPAGGLRPSSYFCVAAYNRRDEVCYSPVFFHQTVDTVPPLAPEGLTAYADTAGGVHLQWQPSASDDVAGYLVLKSRRADGALAWMLYPDPLPDTVYTDSIDALMWQAAYYCVVAVDGNGNLSEPCAPVTVYPNRPNPVAPPLFDGCGADDRRIKIRWLNSMDEHVASYALYVAVDSGEMQLVARRRWDAGDVARPTADSLYYALPKGRALDTRYRFFLAVETPTGDTVWAPQPYVFEYEATLSAPRLQAWAERGQRCVAVQWQTPAYASVVKAYIYRKSAGEPYRLLRVLTSSDLAGELYVDQSVRMNTEYTYRLQFETGDGRYTPFGHVAVAY